MKPGDIIERHGAEWTVERVEMRGHAPKATHWALITRYEGTGLKRKCIDREWIPIRKGSQ